MKIISRTMHGVLDYLVGIALIAAPWLFGFARNGAETWTPVIIGSVILIYSLFTNYELGVFREIQMSTHLWLDRMSGLFLAVSPWLFNYNELVYLPHLLVGLLILLVAMMTRLEPDTLRTHMHA